MLKITLEHLLIDQNTNEEVFGNIPRYLVSMTTVRVILPSPPAYSGVAGALQQNSQSALASYLTKPVQVLGLPTKPPYRASEQRCGHDHKSALTELRKIMQLLIFITLT